jgi:chromosome segregation ATPase
VDSDKGSIQSTLKSL